MATLRRAAQHHSNDASVITLDSVRYDPVSESSALSLTGEWEGFHWSSSFHGRDEHRDDTSATDSSEEDDDDDAEFPSDFFSDDDDSSVWSDASSLAPLSLRDELWVALVNDNLAKFRAAAAQLPEWPTLTSPQGWSPLVAAGWYGAQTVALHLLQEQEEQDEESKPNATTTVLHTAVRGHHEHLVCALLAHPFAAAHYLNAVDEQGYTPLHAACHAGHVDIVTRLLQHPRVNLQARNPHNGYTPLHSAVARNQVPVVDLLLQQQGLQTSVNVGDHEGNTPLHVALEEDSTVVAVLLLHHANTDYQVRNHAGQTPLQRASSQRLQQYTRLMQGVRLARELERVTIVQHHAAATAAPQHHHKQQALSVLSQWLDRRTGPEQRDAILLVHDDCDDDDASCGYDDFEF